MCTRPCSRPAEYSRVFVLLFHSTWRSTSVFHARARNSNSTAKAREAKEEEREEARAAPSGQQEVAFLRTRYSESCEMPSRPGYNSIRARGKRVFRARQRARIRRDLRQISRLPRRETAVRSRGAITRDRYAGSEQWVRSAR